MDTVLHCHTHQLLLLCWPALEFPGVSSNALLTKLQDGALLAAVQVLFLLCLHVLGTPKAWKPTIMLVRSPLFGTSKKGTQLYEPSACRKTTQGAFGAYCFSSLLFCKSFFVLCHKRKSRSLSAFFSQNSQGTAKLHTAVHTYFYTWPHPCMLSRSPAGPHDHVLLYRVTRLAIFQRCTPARLSPCHPPCLTLPPLQPQWKGRHLQQRQQCPRANS